MITKSFLQRFQILFLVLALNLIFLLFFLPSFGLTLFWNILVPVIPVLVFILPGFWRNICPLATTSLMPARLAFSRKIKISSNLNSKLQLIGVFLFFIIAPLRHIGLNVTGELTGVFLLFTGVVAVIFGFFFDLKSAWCSGLCPLHPVEKLYGSRPIISFKNIQCKTCSNCTRFCPDSTKKELTKRYKNEKYAKLASEIMYGGFPGFIWGWFKIRDYSFVEGLNHILEIYFATFLPAILTMIIYLLLKKTDFFLKSKIDLFFSSTSISIYYWFRIPQLIGHGEFPNDGMLINLSSYISPNYLFLIKIALSFLFFSLSFSVASKSWSYRPTFSIKRSEKVSKKPKEKLEAKTFSW